MANREFDLFFKFLLIGDSGVGKTCVLFRFAENAFNPSFIHTIGIDFKIKTLQIGEYWVSLRQLTSDIANNSNFFKALDVLSID